MPYLSDHMSCGIRRNEKLTSSFPLVSPLTKTSFAESILIQPIARWGSMHGLISCPNAWKVVCLVLIINRLLIMIFHTYYSNCHRVISVMYTPPPLTVTLLFVHLYIMEPSF